MKIIGTTMIAVLLGHFGVAAGFLHIGDKEWSTKPLDTSTTCEDWEYQEISTQNEKGPWRFGDPNSRCNLKIDKGKAPNIGVFITCNTLCPQQYLVHDSQKGRWVHLKINHLDVHVLNVSEFIIWHRGIKAQINAFRKAVPEKGSSSSSTK
ncbi:hypothetical protein PCASD_19782 [Puccinia coronata f. sp. avenae]|uniref:Uncharacterized protein n=2 Tax=Puccinia coronata f. sp. avenae TaxID=200324 RepID=A0A2N5TXM0_9BASI|nr:hypothetical protein PCASD_19782 [Puccinia coronata f. sp. avenae]